MLDLINSFKDAVATIRRTSIEHQFQLVITRAYEEGEEQLLDEDAECKLIWDDKGSFLVELICFLQLGLWECQPRTSACSC